MFVCHHQSSILVLLLYVDGMLLTINNPNLTRTLIAALSTYFVIKDLNYLYYFLGVQVVRISAGVFL